MLKKYTLLNFTYYQIVDNYGHIDGFTKDLSPRLNFFLLGCYYNLNVFQLFYSVSFLKAFFFIYNNITIRGLPTLLISTFSLFKNENTRFLQYYSFGKWTFGLFSNWNFCKASLNISKFPFLNRKIKTIPKIMIALNNNFFLEREVHRDYKSMLTFTFLNSNYFDNARYFSPLNANSIISIKFYLKIFYSLYDKSFDVKLYFFLSLDFLKNFFLKKPRLFVFLRRNKKIYKRKKYKKIPKRKRAKRTLKNVFWGSSQRTIFNSLTDSIRMSKLIYNNRVRARKTLFPKSIKKSWLSISHNIYRKFWLKNYYKKKLNKKKLLNLKRRRNRLFKKKTKNIYQNLIFFYIKKILKTLKREKKLNVFFEILKKKMILHKIKKLIILKLLLKYLKLLLVSKNA